VLCEAKLKISINDVSGWNLLNKLPHKAHSHYVGGGALIEWFNDAAARMNQELSARHLNLAATMLMLNAEISVSKRGTRAMETAYLGVSSDGKVVAGVAPTMRAAKCRLTRLESKIVKVTL
jgi:hypothetical protein